MPLSDRLQPGPTTLYAQLSSIMRAKITNGEWPDGSVIPTLSELCGQYRVARVTARQATQALVQEGLLSSMRGRRTVVTYTDPIVSALGSKPLLSSAGTTGAVHNLRIEILEERIVDALPATWSGYTAPGGPYVWISKVSRDGNDPFALSETYIPKRIFDRFPKGGETRRILADLMRDYSDPPVASGFERLRVAAADYQEARHLDCPMSEPLARIKRVFFDAEGTAIYFTKMSYRADRFELETDLAPYIQGELDSDE
jgi:GntR family transcriptional regulator